MEFEVVNVAGDRLRIEVTAGKFTLAGGVELEATPAPPRQERAAGSVPRYRLAGGAGHDN